MIKDPGGSVRPLLVKDVARELHKEAKAYYSGAGIKDAGKFAACKESKEHLRSALADLEEDGVCERQSGDGKPLIGLSLEERKRLPSGKTQLRFFAVPKPADTDSVLEEWSDFQAKLAAGTDDMSKVEVAKVSLPLPPIQQILKLFKIPIPEKAQITSSIYQKAVARGYEEAKKVFIQVVEQEVANGSLPTVAPESLPEVANGSGTIRNTSQIPGETKPASASEEVLSSSSSFSVVEKKSAAEIQTESTTTTSTEPEYATVKDELAALITKATGHAPDQKLFRDICDTVEIARSTLREYIDDITPRLSRLRTKPGPGFFLSEAKKLGTSAAAPVPEPETLEQQKKRTGPCLLCKNLGRIGDTYCTCRMGVDLERVEKRQKTKSAVS